LNSEFSKVIQEQKHIHSQRVVGFLAAYCWSQPLYFTLRSTMKIDCKEGLARARFIIVRFCRARWNPHWTWSFQPIVLRIPFQIHIVHRS
jgi:hypothetical protein